MQILDTDNLPDFLPPLKHNIGLDTDSYKMSHWAGLQAGTKRTYSYIESRGGRYPGVMLAGLQDFLYNTLGQRFTEDDFEELAAFAPAHGLKFNREGWRIIRDDYDGFLPLLIKSAPEGLLVPTRNALISVENTDDRMAFLPSYIETTLLRRVWTGATIAARIWEMMVKINRNWVQYSDNPLSPFALMDFSSRGTMGYDHSVVGGLAHLMFQKGSDNVPAIRHANHTYFSDMSAWSVAASEHSISSAFGHGNDEGYIRHAVEHMVDEGGILSLVGDTWDIFKFAQKAVELRELIENKKVTLVVRPDSGEMRDVLPRVLKTLADGFGTTTNSKGMEVINNGVKVLQGDGMDEQSHMVPWEIATSMGIAPDSVMTAAGGGLLTADLDRDTNKWAMKASEMLIGEERINIYKDPITDPGKKSKTGRFALVRDDAGAFSTINRVNDAEDTRDLLQPRYYNGRTINASTIDQVRERVQAQLDATV